MVIIKFSIEFEAKQCNHLFVGSFSEAKHYQHILLDHMMIPKSKFLSKFSIHKWSFVNYELFKSLELTKYIFLIIFLINTFFLQQDCFHHQFNCFVWEKLSPQEFATILFSLSIQLICVRKTISSRIFLLMTHTSLLEICSSSNFLVL